MAVPHSEGIQHLLQIEAIHLKVLSSTPKSRLIKLKAYTPEETRVRGWLYEFELEAPVEIQELGFYARFGEKNSMGFGCVKVGNHAEP